MSARYSVKSDRPGRPEPLPGRARTRSGVRGRVYELLEPSTGAIASRLVDVCLVILILLNVAAVLLASMEPLAIAWAGQFATFELVSVVVFSAEYVCRIWVCVEDDANAGSSALAARLRYMASGYSVIDLLAVLPFYLATFGLLGNADMRMLRVLRLLRLLKLTRYAGPLSLLLQVLRENARNFAATIGILLIVMLLAASGIYIFEREAQPEDFGSIPESMWWAFSTLTTVGYGDVTPITPLGRAFGAAITVVSIGIVALPAGLLASSFSERLRQKSIKYRRLADRAVADGVVTEDESAELERERRELGIGQDLAATIILDESYRIQERSGTNSPVCPHCGQVVGGAGGEAD